LVQPAAGPPTAYTTPVPEIEYVRTFARVAQIQLRSVLDALTEQVEKLGQVPQFGPEDQAEAGGRPSEGGYRATGSQPEELPAGGYEPSSRQPESDQVGSQEPGGHESAGYQARGGEPGGHQPGGHETERSESRAYEAGRQSSSEPPNPILPSLRQLGQASSRDERGHR
jgi:hypothetical protein